jgi:hypothetical protein
MVVAAKNSSVATLKDTQMSLVCAASCGAGGKWEVEGGVRTVPKAAICFSAQAFVAISLVRQTQLLGGCSCSKTRAPVASGVTLAPQAQRRRAGRRPLAARPRKRSVRLRGKAYGFAQGGWS